MHYYQFNIGDYRRQTHHLTLLEHAVYRALLDTYYLTEQPLCSDLAKLMRSHSVRTADEKQALENVLDDFFLLTENGYTHESCDEVIAKYHEKSDKARASAQARWGKNTKSMRTHSESNADGMLTNNHKPITNNQLEKPKAKRFVPPTLDEVRLYFYEKGERSSNEPAKFYAFYESNGWKVGKNKMKNWKQAITGWIARNQDNNQQRTGYTDKQLKNKQLTDMVFHDIDTNNTDW